MELLHTVFHHVCGQPPGRTWHLDSLSLPVCQRCTGLYIGAALAVVFLLWFRPPLTRAFLAWHGGCLLGMAPFGLHWIEHGPAVRTLTGLGFGTAVVVFLWVVPVGRSRRGTGGSREWGRPGRRVAPTLGPVSTDRLESPRWLRDQPAGEYLLAMSAAGVAVPGLCLLGGRAVAWLLTAAIVAGGLCLLSLLLLNVWTLLAWAAWGRRPRALDNQA